MFADDLTWTELDDAEHNEAAFAQMKPVAEVLEAHPWLGVCEQIAEKEGFFHWELDFAPVFAQRGGFDLQVGNPPWVRPDWDDNLVLGGGRRVVRAGGQAGGRCGAGAAGRRAGRWGRAVPGRAGVGGGIERASGQPD